MLSDNDNPKYSELIALIERCPEIVPVGFQTDEEALISPESLWRELMRTGAKPTSQIARQTSLHDFEAWMSQLSEQFPVPDEFYLSFLSTPSLPWMKVAFAEPRLTSWSWILPIFNRLIENQRVSNRNVAIMPLTGSTILAFRDDGNYYLGYFLQGTKELENKISQRMSLEALIASIPGLHWDYIDETQNYWFTRQSVRASLFSNNAHFHSQISLENSQSDIDAWLLQCFHEFWVLEQSRDVKNGLGSIDVKNSFASMYAYGIEAHYQVALGQFPDLSWRHFTASHGGRLPGSWLLPLWQKEGFQEIIVFQASFGVIAENFVFGLRKDQDSLQTFINKVGY